MRTSSTHFCIVRRQAFSNNEWKAFAGGDYFTTLDEARERARKWSREPPVKSCLTLWEYMPVKVTTYFDPTNEIIHSLKLGATG